MLHNVTYICLHYDIIMPIQHHNMMSLLWPGIGLDHKLVWVQSTSIWILMLQIRICSDEIVVYALFL